MPTNRLYYSDCYLNQFSSEVVDTAEDRRRVYLESTAFYPTSGGQPYDLGTLAGIPVVEIVEENDRIAHILNESLPASAVVEGRIEGQIDWLRRYDHMQQHTGQHLLSAVFLDALNAPTLSFHMGPEVSTVELGVKELADAQTEQIEARVNQIVWEGRPVEITFEDAEAVRGLRKASERTGVLRIVEIAGVDRSACGGTHVRSTAELGPIQILRWEKLRGNARVEFVCGGRALRRAKQEHRTLLELSRVGSTAWQQLPDYVTSLKDRLSESEKTQQRMVAELARREGEEAYQQTTAGNGGVRRWFVETATIDETIRARSQAYARLSKAIVLVTATEPAGVLIACSPDSGINAGSVLKAALARAGGRGGGSATLAQGGLPDATVLRELKVSLGFGG